MEMSIWYCPKCDKETYNWKKCPRCKTAAVYTTFVLVPKTVEQDVQADGAKCKDCGIRPVMPGYDLCEECGL